MKKFKSKTGCLKKKKNVTNFNSYDVKDNR